MQKEGEYMKDLVLGSTGIKTPKNAFGALPIQRVSMDEAVKILRKAYEGGMTYFDTARAYSDSEEKLGNAFKGMRDKVFIATKTAGKTGDDVRKDLDTSLKMLQTDYIDVYQLHQIAQVYRPDDGTGVYEALEEAKKAGKIRHFGVTAHLLHVATEAAESGLYETMQYPFSYLSMDKEFDLVKLCAEKNMGYIAMKSLAGGLITDSRVAMAFMNQQEHVLPIWGIQKESELDEWLSYMHKDPEMDDEARAVIARDREELSGEFCRGCAYCVPTCPQHITINQCARMGLMLRRAPSEAWLTEYWQNEMKKAETCIECGMCRTKCPYGLDTPRLLKENIEDYKKVLAGEIKVQ